jgi:hypothetical protein
MPVRYDLLDHDDTIDMVLPFTDPSEHFVGDVTRDVVEMSGSRMRKHDRSSGDIPTECQTG